MSLKMLFRKKLISLFSACLFLIPYFSYAEECIFDETVYINFIKQYAKEHKDAHVLEDGKTLIVKKASEDIQVTGGGCDHLGISIEVKTYDQLNEKQLFEKLVLLSKEYAHWLLDEEELKSALDNNNWNKDDDIYRISLNEMTSFEASYSTDGKISINAYIN